MVGSGLRSVSSAITGMRTPRRLDFLPLEENHLPTSSNTEQPPSSSEAAASTRQRRTARDFIYFAGAAAGAAFCGGLVVFAAAEFLVVSAGLDGLRIGLVRRR